MIVTTPSRSKETLVRLTNDKVCTKLPHFATFRGHREDRLPDPSIPAPIHLEQKALGGSF